MTMVEMNASARELLSDLMDGRLRDLDCERALRIVRADKEIFGVWATYHVIGDSLRSADLVQNLGDDEFLERVRERIGDGGGFRDIRTGAVDVDQIAPKPQPQPLRDVGAANESSLRMLVGGLGVLALVLAVAWFGGDGAVIRSGGQEIATGAPAGPLAVRAELGAEPIMIRDPQLDQLLAAHRQSGGGTALQGPAGFIRNAAFQDGLAK